MAVYSDENIYLIWLLPSENSRIELTSKIQYLAKKYNTRPFIPHCTVFKVQGESLKDVIALLAGMKGKIKPVELICREINYRKKIQRSLFLEVELTSELKALYLQIKNNFPTVKHDKFKPHISLMYSQNVTMKEKELLTHTVLFHNNYSFDKIALVSSLTTFGNWKIEYQQALQKESS